MNAETFYSKDGIYLVNWGVVGRIIRSGEYVRALKRCTQSHVVYPVKNWLWNGPAVAQLDTDWNEVRRQTDTLSELTLTKFYWDAKENMQKQIATLADWIQKTAIANANFELWQRRVHDYTVSNILDSVEQGEHGLETAKLIRDLSAEGLIVCCAFVELPAAFAVRLGAAAVGAGLKATARAQDHPEASKTSILATFGSEFALAYLDIKVAGKIKNLAEDGKYAKGGLAILWNMVKGHTFEPGKAWIQGGKPIEIELTGAFKSVGGIASVIASELISGKFGEKSTLAIAAETVVNHTADKLVELLGKEEKGENHEHGGPPRIYRPLSYSQALIDSITFQRNVIENYAVRQIGSSS
jgi:hypothetical protein